MRLREHSFRLDGDRVVLRPMTEDDWGILLRWNNDPDVLYFAESEDVSSQSLERVQQIYRSISQKAFCFIIEIDNIPVGECWLQQMNLERILNRYPGKDCRRIDLMIGEKELWGQGIGNDVIATLTRFGFEVEKVDYIFGCDIGEYNPRSLRSFQKNGYHIDARMEEIQGKTSFKYDLAISREEFESN